MTLKLKSDPAAPDQRLSRDEYLTTVGAGRLNPEDVLAQTSTETVVLIVVAVMPRLARTGLLEERGDWIHALWSAALDKMPLLAGCRMTWNEVFFVAETTDLAAVQEQFRQILLPPRRADLESRCVLSLADGNSQEKAVLLDEMGHDLTTVYVGTTGFQTRFRHKLKDGIDWQE